MLTDHIAAAETELRQAAVTLELARRLYAFSALPARALVLAVLWLYVRGNLIRRLNVLSARMTGLAEGDRQPHLRGRTRSSSPSKAKWCCTRPCDSPGAPLCLCFRVEDIGKGIDPDAMERIFAPFQQEDSQTARTYGGTGLGLSISRRQAGMLGGVLSAENRPGMDAAFTLTVPFQRAKAVPEPVLAPAPVALRGR